MSTFFCKKYNYMLICLLQPEKKNATVIIQEWDRFWFLLDSKSD